MQMRLPDDYRNTIQAFGLPRPTIALLDVIVDREIDLHDVSDFLSPIDMVKVTEDWRELGLPDGLFAFATDCSGNLFCFPAQESPSAMLPVFFFDHEVRQADLVASSFIEWIEGFCSLSSH